MATRTGARFTTETARELGAKGGRASAARHRPLSAQLPPLDTPDHIRTTLQLAVAWVADKLLTGVAGGVIVRACEAARVLREAEATFEVIEGLRAEIRTLAGQRDAALQEVEQLRIELTRVRRIAGVPA